MKTKLFTLLLAVAASVGTMFAWDYAHVQIGDLYYNFDAELQTAEVTFYEEDLSDGHFNTGWTIVSVDIPSAVTHNGTIYNVTRIGAYAFAHCFELTSITIPNSITSIGELAFFASNKLSSVTMESSTPPIAELEYQDGETYNIFTYSGCDHGRGAIFVPCGSLEAYQIAEGWSEYSSIIKYIPASYPITRDGEKGKISIPSNLTICDESVEVTATPIRGCYFVSWSDGNTDNPRIINVDQYESLNAIFDYLLEGKCGKDSALVWKLDTTTMALEITGKGALSENYTYGTFIESLIIGNEVTTIGQSAFYGCSNLKNVILGSSVKVLEEYAFYYCSAIETITCYSQRPPTVNNYALYGLDYSSIVYVPADYLETYKMHDAWGLYDVRPLGEPIELQYIINYLDNEANLINNESVKLHFPQAPEIAGFTFIGWRPLASIIENNTIEIEAVYKADEQSAAPEIVVIPANKTQKLIRDGNVYILKGDKTYTLQGQEVK